MFLIILALPLFLCITIGKMFFGTYLLNCKNSIKNMCVETNTQKIFSLVWFFHSPIHLNFLGVLMHDYFEVECDLVLGVLQHMPELFIFLLDRHNQLQRHLGKWSVFASYLEDDFKDVHGYLGRNLSVHSNCLE